MCSCALGWVICCLGLWMLTGSNAFADEIILRDLTVIKNVRVMKLDVTGVTLSDGRVISWDKIDTGKITGPFQEKFDTFQSELSLPLYRLATRLQGNEYHTLSQPAEELYPKFVGKQGPAADMVYQAVLRSRIYMAEREKTVEVLLRCIEALRQDGYKSAEIAGAPPLKIDPETGYCARISPFWFDSESAKEVLPYVLRSIADMEKPYPAAARAYYANLATAAGDYDRAEFILEGFNQESKRESELSQICHAYLELLRGDEPVLIKNLADWESFLPEHQPLALWLHGKWQLQQNVDPDHNERAMLELLRVAASFDKQDPDLAAAALWECREHLLKHDAAKAERLKQEILTKYPKSFFGRKASRLPANPAESSTLPEDADAE